MSHFDKPKFHPFIQYFLNTNCDMEEQIKERNSAEKQYRNNALPQLLNKAMRIIIIENIPHILVSDGHNFLEAVFTKESINEFRKFHSHVKFSSLRDKVIYVQKWSLVVEQVDSRKVFNSYNNLCIKIVVESFKPMMHEQLNQRLTHNATSIFRDTDIQTLIRSYRHWFSQTLIKQNQSSIAEEKTDFDNFPSFSEIFTDSSENQISNENFGAIILQTQVFRVDNDFPNGTNLKFDLHDDLTQFKIEIDQKRQIQTRDMRFAELDRIITQEKGEQHYAEKKFSKSRQWLDNVEDEFRREFLKNKIEYFQIEPSAQEAADQLFYETKLESEERQKQYKMNHYRSTRRIVGYTLGNSVESIKEKLIKLLKCSKYNTDATRINSSSPMKGVGRPRSNSQENILVSKDTEDSKTNMDDTLFIQPRKFVREPLSQFVQHKIMPDFHDDDTQSEPDSMDEMDEMEAQLYKEQKNIIKGEQDLIQQKIDEVIDSAEPIGLSLYRSYLEWFTQNELMRIDPTEIPKGNKSSSVKHVESQVTKPESEPMQEIQNENIIDEEASEEEMERDFDMAEEKQQPLQEIKEEQQDVEMTESIRSIDSISDEIQQEIQYSPNTQKLNAQIIIKQFEEQQANFDAVSKKLKEKLDVLVSAKEKNLINAWNRNEKIKQIDQNIDLVGQNIQNIESQLQNQKQDALLIINKSKTEQELFKKKAEDEKLKFEAMEKQLFDQYNHDLEMISDEEDRDDSQAEFDLQKTDRNQAYQRIVLKQKQEIRKITKEADKIKEDLLVTQKEREEELHRLQQEEIELNEDKKQLMFESEQQDRIAEQRKLEEDAIEKEIALNQDKIKKEKAILLEKKRLQAEQDKKLELERQKQETERKKREQIEKEKIKRALIEKEKQAKEEALRQENLRLMKEKEEKALREKVEKEKAEKQAKKQAEIQAEKLAAEKIAEGKRQEEALKLAEKEKKLAQDKILQEQQAVVQKNEAAARLQETKDQKARQEAEQQSHIEHRLRQIEEQKFRVIEQQKRLKRQQEEQQERERIRQLEENEKAAAAQSQAQPQNQVQEQSETVEDEDLDWEEGGQSLERQSLSSKQQSLSSEQWHNQIENDSALEENRRQDFVSTMNKKFGHQISHEIRKCETRDLSRRDIKNTENNDKLFDFMQIKKIKREKNMELQRKQMMLESNSSQHESKENSLKGHQTDQEKLKYIKECKNYKISENNDDQTKEIDVKQREKLDDQLNNNIPSQYNLFDQDITNEVVNNDNDQNCKMMAAEQYSESYSELDENEIVDNQSELKDSYQGSEQQMEKNHQEVQNINTESPAKTQKEENFTPQTPPQTQAENPFHNNQMPVSQPQTLNMMLPPVSPVTATTPATQSELTILELQKQILALTHALGNITQQVSIISSQNTFKQGPPNDLIEDKTQKSEKSDEDFFVPTFGSQVQTIVKNNDGNVEPFNIGLNQSNRDNLKRNFSNMQTQEPKGYQRNEFDKLADEQRMKEHRKKIEQQKAIKQEREMKYKTQVRKSIGHPEHHGHNQQNQESDQHRNRDRQRIHRSQSQDRQQPMQPHRRNEGQHSKSNQRRSPSEPRQSSTSGEFKQQNNGVMQSNRVDGSKRYVHSQLPAGQDPSKKTTEPFNNIHNGENLKRRRLSESQEQIQ